MADPRYIKSVFWLVSFGGIGYVLQKLTAPSEEKIAKIRALSGSKVFSADDHRRSQLFTQRLKEAGSIGTKSTVVVDKKEK